MCLGVQTLITCCAYPATLSLTPDGMRVQLPRGTMIRKCCWKAARADAGSGQSALGYVAELLALDVRWIYDMSDHTWVEYYSSAMGRWLHMDPCEVSWVSFEALLR